ncbi:MAG: hypothetical protein U0746_00950 [Gemmataceae bacterium]
MTFQRGRTSGCQLVAGIAVLLGSLAASAQAPATSKDKDTKAPRDDSKITVPLPTLDGAELSGTFYRGNRGRDTPCVLMIHDRGKDRSKAEWDALARALQADGFAVLTFDLRGHGASTVVNRDFWNPGFANLKSGFKGSGLAKTTTINSDFKQGYFPWLVQDVAAARRYLDQKNDTGDCNSGSLIVIGAGEGASLALLWVSTEFNRYYNVGFVPLKSNGTPKLAGDDIAGCVALSAVSRPASGGNYNLNDWVRAHPAIREKVPMGFIVGDRDTKAKTDAEAWVKLLKTLPNGKENPKAAKLIEIKGTELSGQNLLANQQFGVKEKIVEYCNDFIKMRKAIPWIKTEVDTNQPQLVNVSRFGFRLP